MANYDEFMNELYDSLEYREWLEERDAEAIAHMEEDFSEEGEEAEDFDTEEYADFMSELIAMATARVADEGMF